MKRRFAALLAAMAMFGLLGAQTVTGAVTISETVPGNYACPSDATKIDPVVGGTYNLVGGGTILIEVYQLPKGPAFGFTTTGASVSSIVVKGGPNYHTYIYSPSSTGDFDLHAPNNPNNGKWYGLSHLCIESDKKHHPG